MKQVILTAAFLLLITLLPAYSQTKGYWQVDVGFSVFNTEHNAALFSQYDYNNKLKGSAELVKSPDNSSFDDGSIRYNDDSGIFFPTIMVNAGYVIPDWNFGFFFCLFWNYAYRNYNGGPSLLQERESILHLIPEVRYYYIDNDKRKAFLTLGVGLRYRRWDEIFRRDRVGYNAFDLTYLLSPIGVELGRKWFFSFDFGLSPAYTPFCVKMGYRF